MLGFLPMHCTGKTSYSRKQCNLLCIYLLSALEKGKSQDNVFMSNLLGCIKAGQQPSGQCSLKITAGTKLFGFSSYQSSWPLKSPAGPWIPYWFVHPWVVKRIARKQKALMITKPSVFVQNPTGTIKQNVISHNRNYTKRKCIPWKFWCHPQTVSCHASMESWIESFHCWPIPLRDTSDY